MTGLVQYDMQFINFLREKGDIPELSMDVIQVINDLAKKVGAPTYNKTPVFKKRNRQPRKKDNMITKQDWENIRNFNFWCAKVSPLRVVGTQCRGGSLPVAGGRTFSMAPVITRLSV